MNITKLFGNKTGALAKLREVDTANKAARAWLSELPARLKQDAATAYERFRKDPNDGTYRAWHAAAQVVPDTASKQWNAESATILDAILHKAAERSLEPVKNALAEMIDTLEHDRDALLKIEREKADRYETKFEPSQTIREWETQLAHARHQLTRATEGGPKEIEQALKFVLNKQEPKPQRVTVPAPINAGWEPLEAVKQPERTSAVPKEKGTRFHEFLNRNAVAVSE